MYCAYRLTAAKRHILEDPDLYYTALEGSNELTELSRAEQRSRRRKVCEKLAMVPGKLDHATVVAYQVYFLLQIFLCYNNNNTRVIDFVSSFTLLYPRQFLKVYLGNKNRWSTTFFGL